VARRIQRPPYKGNIDATDIIAAFLRHDIGSLEGWQAFQAALGGDLFSSSSTQEQLLDAQALVRLVVAAIQTGTVEAWTKVRAAAKVAESGKARTMERRARVYVGIQEAMIAFPIDDDDGAYRIIHIITCSECGHTEQASHAPWTCPSIRYDGSTCQGSGVLSEEEDEESTIAYDRIRIAKDLVATLAGIHENYAMLDPDFVATTVLRGRSPQWIAAELSKRVDAFGDHGTESRKVAKNFDTAYRQCKDTIADDSPDRVGVVPRRAESPRQPDVDVVPAPDDDEDIPW
jgi:hypothetical protein